MSRIVSGAVALCLLCLATRAWGQSRVTVEAIRGEPFGVGRLTLASGDVRINLPRRDGPRRGGRVGELARRLADRAGVAPPPPSLETTDMALSERSGRLYYPVFEKRERPILSEFIQVPRQITVYFLFRGDGPLDLTLYAPDPQVGAVVPLRDPEAHARLLRSWWSSYSAAAGAASTPSDFPPLVEEYLVDTLARRLNLPLAARPPTRATSVIRGELNMLAGTELARQEVARAILLDPPPVASTLVPLPENLPAPRPEILNPSNAQIEPLAGRVPVECFYVRFGSFANFLWLRQRLTEWGGEVRDIISERGFDYGLNARMERQLGLRESKTAELFGDAVIADVALIGADAFLREGAAIGVLFQAKNSLALMADFTQQRAALVKENPGATLQNLRIGGRAVTLVSTPDNRVRSFYASDGDFHLITTSHTLVEWFLATGKGDHPSLAASEAFRLAREHLPLERNDTVFAYLSPEFFQHLFSPHYQIELKRRMRSTVEIELVRIARLAARGEGSPAYQVAELIQAGYLPAGFGTRADGSQLVVDADRMSDSLRGAAGTYLPVLDMPVTQVTPAELAEYQQFAQAYTASWGAMDPIVAGIQREALPGGKLERVVLDVKAAPLSQQHVETLARWLGPPATQRLAPVTGDIVSFEAVLRGGSFFAGGDHHLFGALRDADPRIALDPRTGLVARILKAQLQGLQGYLGAWPDPGYLRFLSGLIETPVDQLGYSQSLSGIWRRQFNGFTLYSFHPEILALASEQLHFVEAERPAQIWLRAEDLANSKLAPLINAYGYRQSRQIALGNTRFLNMLIEQLHVPAADALTTAETLLDAKLLEPLGGKYELRSLPGGPNAWISTSLLEHPDASQPPADYQFPALTWFRGIEFELLADNGLLALHGELIMPAETKSTGFQLPSLPFGLSPKSNTRQTPPPPAEPAAPQGRREF